MIDPHDKAVQRRIFQQTALCLIAAAAIAVLAIVNINRAHSESPAKPHDGPAVVAAPARVAPPGIVKEKPSSGRFVPIDGGYMVPYTATIPGTDVKFEMIPIAGGKFKLGSPDSEHGHKKVEEPQLDVEVAPFWMGKYEITWAEYGEFMKLADLLKRFESAKLREVAKDNTADAVTAPSNLYEPSYTFKNGQNPKLPAVTMSQFAAKQYTKWLSKLTADFYRLPSEAEWEYACRAGTTTAYTFGDDPAELGKYAWFAGNSKETTHEVGQKLPNPWGLYDMYGNASEWVLDQYLPEGYAKFGGKPQTWRQALVWPTKLFPRVLKGGSLESEAAECRSAARRPSDDDAWREIDPNSPKSPYWFTEAPALGVGFRILRPLEVPAAGETGKYWDSDVASIPQDVADRLNGGKGAVGLVDPTLPQDAKKLDETRRPRK